MVKLFDRLQLPWTIDTLVVSPTGDKSRRR
jgi:hypothetical protein